MVSTVDKIIELLQAMGWAWRTQIHPSQVGVDPDNRDGVGIVAEDVHHLGADILRLGFSWREAANAVCIEDDPASDELKVFNRKLCIGSDLLPDKDLGLQIYGSLACSHTNMFLRCLLHGSRTVGGCAASGDDGRLSLEKVVRKDSAFAEAARKGLVWTVLSSKCRSHFPKLRGLVQQAYNAGHSVVRSENEVQIMLRMYNMAVEQQKRTGHIDWKPIHRRIRSMKPPCEDDLWEMCLFIADVSGGMDGEYLHELVAFHRCGLPQTTSPHRR